MVPCPQPNSRLLINYGIVDEDNPYDKLPLSSEQGSGLPGSMPGWLPRYSWPCCCWQRNAESVMAVLMPHAHQHHCHQYCHMYRHLYRLQSPSPATTRCTA